MQCLLGCELFEFSPFQDQNCHYCPSMIHTLKEFNSGLVSLNKITQQASEIHTRNECETGKLDTNIVNKFVVLYALFIHRVQLTFKE